MDWSGEWMALLAGACAASGVLSWAVGYWCGKRRQGPPATDLGREFAESASDWLWETDSDHRFSWFSGTLQLTTGIDPQILLGRFRWDLAAFDQDIDATAWQDHMDDLAAWRPFRDFRYWIKTDRGPRWVTVSGTPRFAEGGHFLGYRGCASDVTSQAETALRLKLLSQVIEQCPVTVVITDPDGIIEWANPQLEVITGYGRDEVIGRTPALFQSGETPPEVYADLWGTIRSGRIWTGELKNRRKDGSFFWESLTIAPVYDDHGAVIHFAAVKEDITFKREATLRMEQQARELQRSNEELEQFAYVASHDLRQPLRMVTSYLTLLDRRLGAALGDENRVFLNYAVDGAKRMEQMILGLLELARVGRDGEIFQSHALSDLIREAAHNLSVLMAEAQAQVEMPKVMPNILGDRLELVRLFQNVIGNAVKYRSPERTPRITITWGRGDKGMVVLRVADNGIGMRAEDCDRAFGIFQRVDGSQNYEGTGIGLAVCRKIVERHGGRISAEAVWGQGSAFIITLPEAETSAKAAVGET